MVQIPPYFETNWEQVLPCKEARIILCWGLSREKMVSLVDPPKRIFPSNMGNSTLGSANINPPLGSNKGFDWFMMHHWLFILCRFLLILHQGLQVSGYCCHLLSKGVQGLLGRLPLIQLLLRVPQSHHCLSKLGNSGAFGDEDRMVLIPVDVYQNIIVVLGWFEGALASRDNLICNFLDQNSQMRMIAF